MSSKPSDDGSVTNDDIRSFYSEWYTGLYEDWWSKHSKGSMHAGYFDDEHTDLGEAVENMQRVLAQRADIGEGDRVLDAGCGLGGPAVWLAEHRGAEVTGLNIADDQLEHARELAADHGVEDRTEFRNDDFTEMETIESDAYDYVWGLEAICYAENKREFIEQAERVLADGGMLVMADGFKTVRNPSAQEQEIIQKQNEKWRLPNIAHVDDFQDALREYDFENVEYEDILEETMPTSEWLTRFSGVVPTITSALERFGVLSEEQQDFFDGYHYQMKAARNDLTTYAIITAEV